MGCEILKGSLKINLVFVKLTPGFKKQTSGTSSHNSYFYLQKRY